MSIYFNTKTEGSYLKRVLYNLGMLLCKSSDVKDYLCPRGVADFFCFCFCFCLVPLHSV